MARPLRESLADYAHRAWAGWMRYLFSKSVHNSDGSVTIPAELVERWKRQVNTPYRNLPANEQESDRDEADKMITIVAASALGMFQGTQEPDTIDVRTWNDEGPILIPVIRELKP